MFAATYLTLEHEPNTSDSEEEHLGDIIYTHLYGIPHRQITTKTRKIRDPDALIALLGTIGTGVDICELFGEA